MVLVPFFDRLSPLWHHVTAFHFVSSEHVDEVNITFYLGIIWLFEGNFLEL